MSDKDWWDAERKAAEFWHKVKENQVGGHARGSVSLQKGSPPGMQDAKHSVSDAPTITEVPLERGIVDSARRDR